MELETIIYLLIVLIIVYYFLSYSNENFEAIQNKECSENDINSQFYNYNVNVINRLVRPN